jgi:hypothetical protein
MGARSRHDDRPLLSLRTACEVRGVFAGRQLVAVAAAGLVASYLLSWDLWQVRVDPPNLPLVAAASMIGLGVPLVTAALSTLVFPRAGAMLHAVLLALAITGDQIRLQPGFISLTIILLAAAWPSRLMVLGRWHLATLWFWAGFHKALSAGWPTGGATFIANAAGVPDMRGFVSVAVPVFEIGLAGLAVWPRTWRILRVIAPLFHVGVVLLLAAVWWNTVVWPWNLAIAAAVPFLFGTESASMRLPASRRVMWPATVAVLLVLYPAGFYVGYVDAYVAHNLYTSNVSQAYVCTEETEPERCIPLLSSILEELNVPLPPEERLFVALFERACAPVEYLRIDGIWTRFGDRTVTYHACSTGTSRHEEPSEREMRR